MLLIKFKYRYKIIMELYIENFKGIRKGNYNFNTDTTTLICGKSGIGKSSILEAISYCICGDNSRGLANISSNGKILVNLKISHLNITRTNKPKRVVVKNLNSGDEYEDDFAQSIIDTYFTPFFKDIGYIKQKGVSSFLQKSCTEKMDFLRLWITNDKNIQNMKSNLKEYTKKVLSKSENINIQLEVAKQMLKECDIPQKIKNPFQKDIDPVWFQKLKNTQMITLQNTYTTNKSKIKTLKGILSNKDIIMRKNELHNKYSQLNIDKIKTDQNNYNELLICIQQLKCINEEENNDINMLNTQKLNSQQQLQMNKQLSNMKLKYTNLMNSVNNEEHILQQIYTNYKYFVDEININENTIIEYTNLSNIQNNFSDIKSKLQYQYSLLKNVDGVQKTKYEYKLNFLPTFFNQLSLNIDCPNCNCKLQVIDSDKLHVKINDNKYENDKCSIDKSLKEIYIDYNKFYCEYVTYIDKYTIDVLNVDYTIRIKELKNKIGILKNNLSLCNGINFDGVKEFKCENSENNFNDLINKYKIINDDKQQLKLILTEYPDITNFVDNSKDLEIQISKLDNLIQSIKYNETINNKINKLKILLNLDDEEVNINNIKTKLNILHKQIDEFNEYKSLLKLKIDNIDSKLITDDDYFVSIENEMCELECINKIVYEIIQKIYDLKDNIKNYIEYNNKQIEYIQKFDKVNSLTQKYTKICNKYNECIKLKSLIEKTEGQMIDTFIYDLNDKIQYYIDQFFIDDTMNIDLRCVKTKKEQPKLTFNIIYKGNNIDEVRLLSGGEYDRLNLAISLSFAELLNLPLLMFDESINTLDEVSCTNVLEKLKESKRTIFVVAHQVEEGIFDNTLKIV